VIVDGCSVDFLTLDEAIASYVHPGAHTLLIQPPKGAVATQITFAAAAGDVLGFGCWLPSGMAWRPQVIVQREPPIRLVGHPPA
jgi:hypothetical protein